MSEKNSPSPGKNTAFGYPIPNDQPGGSIHRLKPDGVPVFIWRNGYGTPALTKELSADGTG